MGEIISMNKNVDIVFLGGLFPKELEDEIFQKSIGNVQVAANVLQWNIIEGIDKCSSVPVKIINSLYIGAYPLRYKDLFIKTHKFRHSKNSNDLNVGFINMYGVKHILRYLALKPHLKKWARNQTENKIILAYALTYTFVRCFKYIKKINPLISTCMIVPDLPEYMNTSNKVSKFYTFLKNIEIRGIKRNIKYIDGYVLLTKYMKEFMNIDKNFVVVEGVSTDIFKDISVSSKNSDIRTILYTGTLNEKYGIMRLLEAFKNISYENYRLIICGDGDSVDKVRHESYNDQRIIFKGQLKRNKALKLQKEATVLINPRQNNEEYTKYSFPSKILEYLSSGTPVISYKLDGIPEEYDDFMYYIDGNKIEDITEKIIEICEKNTEERMLFGEKARKFVLETKNNVKQAEKILKMIRNL